MGNIRRQLGTALASARRHEEALVEFREAEQVFASMHDLGRVRACVTRAAWAMVLIKLGRIDEADAIHAPMLERPPRDPVAAALVEGSLGTLRCAQGRHEEGQALLRRAADFFADAPVDRYRALHLTELGWALVDAGRATQALEVLAQAQSMFRKVQHNGSTDLADVAVAIARAYLALGDAQAALLAAEEAAAFWQRFDASHRDAGVALLWLARALAATGRSAEAHPALQR